MPSRLKELVSKRLATPPSGLENQIQYEVYMGSAAYGCSNDTSDIDVYGFAIPEKRVMFPHLSGYIEGFGSKPAGFETYTQHHMIDTGWGKADEQREYDYCIHTVAKFFKLCMGANPNMLDTLFVPLRCILFTTPVGAMVRENRHLFVSQKCIHTFRGYAFEQLHKLRIKNPSENSKRSELVEKYGYDVKFAYHIVRLLLEVEQLLTEGSMDLERDREVYKSIRRGEWKLEDIEEYFKVNEPRLVALADKSKLPHSPSEEAIKKLLLNCLEQHFGSIDDCVVTEVKSIKALREIEEIINKYRSKELNNE